MTSLWHLSSAQCPACRPAFDSTHVARRLWELPMIDYFLFHQCLLTLLKPLVNTTGHSSILLSTYKLIEVVLLQNMLPLRCIHDTLIATPQYQPSYLPTVLHALLLSIDSTLSFFPLSQVSFVPLVPFLLEVSAVKLMFEASLKPD